MEIKSEPNFGKLLWVSMDWTTPDITSEEEILSKKSLMYTLTKLEEIDTPQGSFLLIVGL